MKLIFASDSFKGSLTAAEIAALLKDAAARHFPEAEGVCLPVADGGEGTLDALLGALGGTRMKTRVQGPLFDPVDAEWALLGDGTAVVEMAQASGLPLVPAARRDPRETTSFGTGQLMAAALRAGARRLLIGIGGSATNDGGMGMLEALGAKFMDVEGHTLPPVGGSLGKVAKADFSGLHPAVLQTPITVICDVTNPLLGENGAAFIYGPQKGATPAVRDELEAGMAHFAAVMAGTLGRDFASFPGAGAAGGLGAALHAVLGADLRRGVDAVLDAVGFDDAITGASLVITGEGRLDGQSVRSGKVISGIARRCREKGVPVAAVVGGVGPGAEDFYGLCDGVILPIVPGPMPLEEAMENAAGLYAGAADRLMRLLKMGMVLEKKV